MMTAAMKTWAGAAVMAAALMIGSSHAAMAQSEYPVGAWCFAVHDNLTPNCSIPTYEQCDLQSLHGHHGECYRNPDYHPARATKNRNRRRD